MAQPDRDKLNALLGRMVGELGAGAFVMPGDRLGSSKSMRSGTWLTAAGLAARTGTHGHDIHGGPSGQAAAGYVEYNASAEPPFNMVLEARP
jgi:hypothetical protein